MINILLLNLFKGLSKLKFLINFSIVFVLFSGPVVAIDNIELLCNWQKTVRNEHYAIDDGAYKDREPREVNKRLSIYIKDNLCFTSQQSFGFKLAVTDRNIYCSAEGQKYYPEDIWTWNINISRYSGMMSFVYHKVENYRITESPVLDKYGGIAQPLKYYKHPVKIMQMKWYSHIDYLCEVQKKKF